MILRKFCYTGHDKFTYTNLAVKNHTIEITATSSCDPSQQIVYRTNIAIGAPGKYRMHCVHIHTNDLPYFIVVDGGWGPWFDLPCTVRNTQCGVGIIRRIRICNNPVPKNGGKPCKGKNIKIRSCGTLCSNSKICTHTHCVYCNSDLYNISQQHKCF